MCDVIDAKGSEDVINQVKDKVSAVCQRLPVYS
jgi:glycine hydroxymethyltransferase